MGDAAYHGRETVSREGWHTVFRAERLLVRVDRRSRPVPLDAVELDYFRSWHWFYRFQVVVH